MPRALLPTTLTLFFAFGQVMAQQPPVPTPAQTAARPPISRIASAPHLWREAGTPLLPPLQAPLGIGDPMARSGGSVLLARSFVTPISARRFARLGSPAGELCCAQGVSGRPPQEAPTAPFAAPHRLPPHLVWVTLAGVAAGAFVGSTGVSYASLPANERGARRWRVSLTYGAIGGALGAGFAALTAPRAEEASSHAFWLDRWNTPLLAGMVAVQTLDYTSTRYFRDRNMGEWLLTDSLVDNRPALIATEAATAVAAIAVAYVLHRTGHHRWERWFEGGYVAMGITSAVANYRYPSTGHALF